MYTWHLLLHVQLVIWRKQVHAKLLLFFFFWVFVFVSFISHWRQSFIIQNIIAYIKYYIFLNTLQVWMSTMWNIIIWIKKYKSQGPTSSTRSFTVLACHTILSLVKIHVYINSNKKRKKSMNNNWSKLE